LRSESRIAVGSREVLVLAGGHEAAVTLKIGLTGRLDKENPLQPAKIAKVIHPE
jgi:hypothetical protein